MKIVLLSGGKGKRLWPLSTDDMPKQFIPIFDNYSSMLKKTYDLNLKKNKKEDIYVATGYEYEEKIKVELFNFDNFIFEPAYIGTFGAILNVAVYLSENKNISLDEIVSIVPIDHDVDENFYNILFDAQNKILNDECSICLIGIEPSFPSCQYGYIIENNGVVESFCEKPNVEKAKSILLQKALWNSGIVVFRLRKIIEIAKNYCLYDTYNDFYNKYQLLPHSSFDKEVLEKEKNIAVVRSSLRWNDLGTWEILAYKMSKPDEYNTNIINFENKKIVNEGVEDAIIINTVNGIKIIKKQVDKEKNHAKE